MKVELKKVKVAQHLSEETNAFTAQLWTDGQYIADLSNDGRGGQNRIYHLFNGGKGLDTRPQVQSFVEWCKAQPPVEDEQVGSLSMDADFYISLMIDEHIENQQVKRWCKSKTVIRLKGDAKGTFHTYKHPYSPEFAQQIRHNHPDLVEIVNERFLT